jgi:hypothetical protein
MAVLSVSLLLLLCSGLVFSQSFYPIGSATRSLNTTINEQIVCFTNSINTPSTLYLGTSIGVFYKIKVFLANATMTVTKGTFSNRVVNDGNVSSCAADDTYFYFGTQRGLVYRLPVIDFTNSTITLQSVLLLDTYYVGSNFLYFGLFFSPSVLILTSSNQLVTLGNEFNCYLEQSSTTPTFTATSYSNCLTYNQIAQGSVGSLVFQTSLFTVTPKQAAVPYINGTLFYTYFNGINSSSFYYGNTYYFNQTQTVYFNPPSGSYKYQSIISGPTSTNTNPISLGLPQYNTFMTKNPLTNLLYFGTSIGLAFEQVDSNNSPFTTLLYTGGYSTGIGLDFLFNIAYFSYLDGYIARVNEATFNIPTYYSPSNIPAINYFQLIPTTKSPILFAAYVNSTTINMNSYVTEQCSTLGNTSCNSCMTIDPNYCGWCASSSTCDSYTVSTCPGGVIYNTQYNLCPQLSSASPLIGNIAGGSIVTITGIGFTNGNPSPLNCVFGSTSVTPNIINNTQITCLSPSGVAGNVTLSVTNNGNQFAPNTFSFQYIDCSQLTSCTSCAAISQCSWCSSTGYCASSNIAPINCSRVFNTTAACPRIFSINPSSSNTGGGSNVTVSGLPFYSDIQFQCIFDGITVNATFINITAITCVAPVGNVSTTPLTINALNYVNPIYASNSSVTFEYFECNTFNNCLDCVALRSSQCYWCLATQNCTAANQNCVGGINSTFGTCPTIVSINPSISGTNGGGQLTIQGSPSSFVSGYNYKCNFGGSLFNATFVNSSYLQCPIPAGDDSTQFTITYLSNQYTTNTKTFIWTGCGYFTNCSDCTTYLSFCGWCLDSLICTESGNCTTDYLQTQCPSITSITPPFAPTNISDYIITLNVSLLNPNITYTCQFGSNPNASSVGIPINSNQVICIAPTILTTSSENIQLFAGNTLYATSTQLLDFITCPQATSCDSCTGNFTTNNYCGWCLESNACELNSYCSYTWASFTGSTSCAKIVSVYPSDISLNGEQNITLTASNPGFIIPINNISYTIFLANIGANYTYNTSDVYQTSQNTLTFIAPPWPYAEFVYIYINYGIYSYFDSGVIIKYSVIESGSKLNKFNYLPVIVGASVGGCTLIAAMFFVIFARRKYKTKSLGYVELSLGDFVPLIFGTYSGSDLYKIHAKQAYLEEFENLLLELPNEKKQETLTTNLTKLTAVTETEFVAKSLVYIFQKHGTAMQLFDIIIRIELEESNETTTLFRGNSVATKMFKYYSKIVGLPYLFHTLAGNIFEICANAEADAKQADTANEATKTPRSIGAPDLKLDAVVRHSFHIDVEVDPTKLSEASDEDVNTYSLLLYCQRILSSIFKSSSYCPVELKEFFKVLKANVDTKFPDSAYKSIGAFYFLRFACSAITVPESYGLVTTKPSSAARRSLVLIAKVLQSLANEVVFGNKEVYMVKMNDFLISNIPKLAEFYEKITTIPNVVEPTPVAEITAQVKNNSLGFLYNHTIQIKNKLDNVLSGDTEKEELKLRIQKTINNIGEPFTKVKSNATHEKGHEL